MTSPREGGRSRAEALLLVVVIIWASNYPLAKYSISRLDIFVFNGLRYIVAAVSLTVIFYARSHWVPVGRADWPKLVWAGVLANVLYQGAFIIGFSMTTAGSSAILLSTAPLWTVFLNARLHHEKIQPFMWAGMLVSLCGIVLIVLGRGVSVGLDRSALYGDIICLVAALLWAFNTNLQKPLLSRYSPLQLGLVMVSVGAVGLTLAAVPGAAAMDWRAIHWTYYAAAVVSGALSIAVANVFWSYGVKKLGPARTGNFGNLVPVLAFVISYLTLDEQLFPLQFAGAALTVIGVWLARR
jgi:drug/metabolite transporter (DMT)-like permease